MANFSNEYVKKAQTPPPPPLGLMYTENQNAKNSPDLTSDQALHFDENLKKLNNILANVTALVGLAKENPLVLSECQRLLQNAADIDLPTEIKNQKIASCPTAVQNMYKQVTNSGSAQAFTQAAKDQNIHMQVQQNLIETYQSNIKYVQPLDAISKALNSNQPITSEMICRHCQNMNIMNNKELGDLDYCDKLMTAFMNARTPEERAKVDAQMIEMAAHAKKRWADRKVWHGNTCQLLDSGKEISAENMERIIASLREEEKVAKQMLQKAKQLEKLAQHETDPEQRKRYLQLAAHLKKGGYEILNENKKTQQAYHRRVRGRSNQANSTSNQSETTNESHVRNSKVLKRSNNLMQRYHSATTQEERNQVLNEMREEAKNTKKRWEDRKNWHKSVNVLFDSGVDITHEQMQTIHASLKEEEKAAKQMLQKAKELEELAKHETDPEQSKRYLELAAHLKKGSSEISSYHAKTMQAYNRKIFETEIPTVSYDKDNIFSQSQPDKPLTLNFANKEKSIYAASINPFQEKGKPNKTEERKNWHKKTRETLSSNKELSSDELKSFDNNLKQEADQANTFLKTADEFKMKAEKETNQQKKVDWLNISDSLETKAYSMLFDNQSSRILYNQKTKAYDTLDNSNQLVEQKPTEEKPVSDKQTADNKPEVNQEKPKTPSETTQTEQQKNVKATQNDASSKQRSESETPQDSPQPKEVPLTLKLQRFGQNVIILDEEKDNLQNNLYDYSAYSI